eukprot:TRINITY_DN5568_c0_g1_i1.p2 TRINITY_DN5568_c0_g1~~TRINITY_DN5568_c0_g1_i1.p2  ORF type:complete len:167 (+),score=34.40 TRINITY_DN5568_c0_g1_i1:119-619(+)
MCIRDRQQLQLSKLAWTEGVSFITIKIELLLQYQQNLLFYILLKIQGKTIESQNVIKRLVYLKTLISKLKPIEKKLEYQINKIFKMAFQLKENKQIDDELQYKPRPGQLQEELDLDQFDINDEGEIVEKEEEKDKQVYHPPKISASLSKEDRLNLRKEQFLSLIHI